MCGIVGYTGFQDAYDIVINGLRRLEYRGYDSAGIVLEGENNAFDVEKYLNHNLTFSKDTEFEMFRIDVTEDEIRQIEIIN